MAILRSPNITFLSTNPRKMFTKYTKTVKYSKIVKDAYVKLFMHKTMILNMDYDLFNK